MRKFLWPVVLLVAGCALPPRQEMPPVPPPATAPAPPVTAAPAEHWKIVASHLELRVYRDGPMQKLGHNHLITSDRLEGEIALREPPTQTVFDFRLPLESLVVDDADARAMAGGEFEAPVPQKDSEGTRRNMLGEHLLDAAGNPVMRLTSQGISGEPGNYHARVRVSLRGAEHVVEVPFTLKKEGDRLEAQASFHLTHADLGLEPFTAALGALKVRDDFQVDLKVKARRGS